MIISLRSKFCGRQNLEKCYNSFIMPYEEEVGLHQVGNLRVLKRFEPQSAGGKTEVLREPVTLVGIEGPSINKIDAKPDKVAEAIRKGLQKATGEVHTETQLGRGEAAGVAFHGDTLFLQRPGKAPDGVTDIPETSIILGRTPKTGKAGGEMVIAVGHNLEDNPSKFKSFTQPYIDNVDKGISAQHVRVSVVEDDKSGARVMVEDMGSTNGTWKSFQKANVPSSHARPLQQTTQVNPGQPLRLNKGDMLFLGGDRGKAKTSLLFQGFESQAGSTGGMAKFIVQSESG